LSASSDRLGQRRRARVEIAPPKPAAQIAALPRPLVFTNGVFDIRTAASSYLDHARRLGASLVVGVNSDASAPPRQGRRSADQFARRSHAVSPRSNR
jgi:bifunctional ADP-heptose synthase (sugar kinase/adenylyltransferase)